MWLLKNHFVIHFLLWEENTIYLELSSIHFKLLKYLNILAIAPFFCDFHLAAFPENYSFTVSSILKPLCPTEGEIISNIYN